MREPLATATHTFQPDHWFTTLGAHLPVPHVALDGPISGDDEMFCAERRACILHS